MIGGTVDYIRIHSGCSANITGGSTETLYNAGSAIMNGGQISIIASYGSLIVSRGFIITGISSSGDTVYLDDCLGVRDRKSTRLNSSH